MARREGSNRLVVALIAIALLCSACGSAAKPVSDRYSTVRMSSPTGQAELILRPAGSVRGLVLFMHGFASDERQLMADSSFFPVRDALLHAGFAIASTNAHGNNVGNAASVRDQQDVVADARRALGASPAVYILAFSMGGLDALLTAATHAITQLRAVALLSPATNTSAFLATGYRGAINAAFGDPAPSALASVVARRNPVLLPAGDYVGYTYRFWSSPTDTIVPATQSKQMVARLVQVGANVSAAALSGDHGDFSLLQPAQVLDLFGGKESP